MARNVPEFANFSHDREQLLNTIARFDNGLRDEDVVGPENEHENLKQYSHTVLIQVLLEFICHAIVKDENHREILLIEACKRLSKFKILNDLLIMDKSNALRLAMKNNIIKFLNQICKESIPSAELNTNAVEMFQNVSLSTDLKLHYCTNFEELGKIADGGFGSVYKAQYKFNKLIYAIKKIPFDYKTDANFLMVMREANNFAALDHLNIVRYYTAWIEMSESDVVNEPPIDDTSFAPDFHKDATPEKSGFVVKEELSNRITNHLSERDSNKDFYKSSKSGESNSIIFDESAEVPDDAGWFVEDYSKSSSDYSEDDTENNEDFSLLNFKIQGVLYIQMEYCDCDLRFWLEKRAETKGIELPFEMDVSEIFMNIVQGVAHIHSRGIIHRDLKPHNIFYSQHSNTVKIGDFGLATLSGFTGDSSNNTSHDHSSSVGTIPYAAPEQRVSKKYDMKVDVYSLGVILIELINVCTTRSELIHIVEDIKKNKIKGNENFPVLGNLASILLNNNPKKRMTAKEILDFIDKDSKVILKEVIRNEFLTEIKEKDEKIQTLNAALSDANDKVKDLDVRYKKMDETLQNLQRTVLKQSSEISKLNQVFSECNIKS